MKPQILPLPMLGIDMLSDETQMPARTARSLVNVDIDRDGTTRRRDGYRIVGHAGARLNGIAQFKGRVLVAQGQSLCELVGEALVPLCDMGADALVDFELYNGAMYVCGPRALWRVLATGEARPVGVRVPSLPTPVPHAAGTLTPGLYAVAIALVDESGEESPAAPLGTLAITAGVMLEGLAVVPGCRWRVYLTPPDGDVLYLAEEFDALLAQHVVAGYPNGAQCQTLHLVPMPAGDFVRGHAGRLYVAAGDTLWFSEALRPHLMAPRRNFVRFEGRIRFLEVLAGGAFVGDDRGVWWLGGNDPTAWTAQLASGTLAIRRSSLRILGTALPGGKSAALCALWLGPQGYMVGTADGAVSALHADRIRVDPACEGRSVHLVRNGVSQVITLTGAATSPATVFGVALDSTNH